MGNRYTKSRHDGGMLNARTMRYETEEEQTERNYLQRSGGITFRVKRQESAEVIVAERRE
jgi:hypothetical protein